MATIKILEQNGYDISYNQETEKFESSIIKHRLLDVVKSGIKHYALQKNYIKQLDHATLLLKESIAMPILGVHDNEYVLLWNVDHITVVPSSMASRLRRVSNDNSHHEAKDKLCKLLQERKELDLRIAEMEHELPIAFPQLNKTK
ncbi:hypothetical protein MA9V1_141 [Chryseobacterium phage MA9V-1]|nr:hypothetical protein MA9V1_141 [Chryseobacterium phage MA9V-1]